jgi:pimeloyl-ACP methyl ester carboxylesterase
VEQIEIETSLGRVAFVGRRQAVPASPALLVITGLFPPRDHMHDLAAAFPEREVLIGRLPGMFAPLLRVNSVEAFGQAYREAVAQALPARKVVTLGVSAGALVALQVPAAARVLMEPFLSIGAPLSQLLRERLTAQPDNAALARYLRELTGLTADGAEDLDFSALLAAAEGPMWALVGDLAARPAGLPTLTTETDRRRLVQHGARLVEGLPGTGHAFAESPEGRALTIQTVKAALAAVA